MSQVSAHFELQKDTSGNYKNIVQTLCFIQHTVPTEGPALKTRRASFRSCIFSLGLRKAHESSDATNATINIEVQDYFETLIYWHFGKKKNCPIPTPVITYVPIPATSSSCGRLFSIARKTFHPARCWLSGSQYFKSSLLPTKHHRLVIAGHNQIAI